jgi:hypothetical protein
MPRLEQSPAYSILKDLAVGDEIPASLYVLDRKDGTRPRWVVQEVEHLELTGGRVLVVVDETAPYDRDLFGRAEQPVALKIITHPTKTLRSRPYLLGGSCGNTLCDLDQQARHVEKAGAR